MNRPTLWEGEKPPYNIPTVEQIAALEDTNGFTLASLFAGGGGSSTGYRWAGYKVPYINEFLPAAQNTYRMNWPDTHIDGRDVRDVTGADILTAAGVKELDVLDGSPPCKAFSTAGKRDENWGRSYEYADGLVQTNDDLVFEYARLVDEVQPRMFVMENVRGLVVGVAKGYFKETFRRLEKAGYKVRAQLLDAQWLGVPQRRVRVFIIGVRNDLPGHPRFPDPLPYRYSIRDALTHVQRVVFDTSGHNQAADPNDDPDEPVRTILAQGGSRSSHLRVQTGGYGTRNVGLNDPVPSILATGGSGSNQKIRLHTTEGPDRRLRAGRIGGGVPHEHGDEPSRTITASGMGAVFADEVRITTAQTVTDRKTRGTLQGGIPDNDSVDDPSRTITARGIGMVEKSEVHLEYRTGYHHGTRISGDDPADTINAGGIRGSGHSQGQLSDGTETRKLTIDEVKALCGFPPDYQLTGSYAQQWYRLGESVPPPMAKAVGEAIAGVLSGMT